MNMTVVLFQIDFDRFSAVAVDLDHQSDVWESKFASRRELLRRLDLAGLVTAQEKVKLQEGKWFEGGAPILKVTVDREAIEDAGFERVKHPKANDSLRSSVGEFSTHGVEDIFGKLYAAGDGGDDPG
jgi:hypothetical protein